MWRSERPIVIFVPEVLFSVLVVAGFGILLFVFSVIWPLMVAVVSESMAPHMHRGDLVFVMDEQRLVPQAAHADTGVVPHQTATATGYWKFGDYGDVIIFKPDGQSTGPPIIHRAMFWVEKGENWYDRADPSFVAAADSCDELQHCPADQAGFITKGDHNSGYDQAGRGANTGPVKPD
jgi:signal peptidase